jgi:hypothetical protein
MKLAILAILLALASSTMARDIRHQRIGDTLITGAFQTVEKLPVRDWPRCWGSKGRANAFLSRPSLISRPLASERPTTARSVS